MTKVLFYLGGIWVLVIIIILLMLAVSGPMDTIAQNAASDITAIEASANASVVGLSSAINSYPVWKWALPVIFGLICTGWVLFKNREELRRGR
jgi:hypothetical protein